MKLHELRNPNTKTGPLSRVSHLSTVDKMGQITLCWGEPICALRGCLPASWVPSTKRQEHLPLPVVTTKNVCRDSQHHSQLKTIAVSQTSGPSTECYQIFSLLKDSVGARGVSWPPALCPGASSKQKCLATSDFWSQRHSALPPKPREQSYGNKNFLSGDQSKLGKAKATCTPSEAHRDPAFVSGVHSSTRAQPTGLGHTAPMPASRALLSGLSLSGHRGDRGLGARKENEKRSWTSVVHSLDAECPTITSRHDISQPAGEEAQSWKLNKRRRVGPPLPSQSPRTYE